MSIHTPPAWPLRAARVTAATKAAKAVHRVQQFNHRARIHVHADIQEHIHTEL